MPFITAARFPKNRYESEAAIRREVDNVQHHLEELALDVGFDPGLNVVRSIVGEEVRIGLSEAMDQYLREAPGTWRTN